MAVKVTTPTLLSNYANAKGAANRVRIELVAQRARAVAGTATFTDIAQLMGFMKNAIAVWNTAAATTGIAAYARDQEGDQTYDPVAEFNALRTATEAFLVWVVNAAPKDGSGFVASEQWNNDGTVTSRQLTAGQNTAIIAQFDTLLALIE